MNNRCLTYRVTINDSLSQADLGQFFQAFVTAEDGMDTISQRFLSASIKLGRPPNQCVVFESSPAGITAAHNCTMKVQAHALNVTDSCNMLLVQDAFQAFVISWVMRHTIPCAIPVNCNCTPLDVCQNQSTVFKLMQETFTLG